MNSESLNSETMVNHKDRKGFNFHSSYDDDEDLFSRTNEKSPGKFGSTGSGTTEGYFSPSKKSVRHRGHSLAASILRVASGEDEDIKEIATEMRCNFRENMLRSTVDRVVNMKMKMLSDTEEALAKAEAAREADSSNSSRKMALILLEKEELQQNLAFEKAKNSALKEKLIQNKLETKQRKLMAHTYKAWAAEITEKQARKKRLCEIAQRSRRTIFDSAFKKWREATREHMLMRMKADAAQHLKDVTTRIVVRYEGKMAEMSQELAQAKKAEKYEAARVLKLEDDLRRALLRGMSALNMEALGIFGDNRTYATQSSRVQVPLRDNQGDYSKHYSKYLRENQI